MEPLWHPPHLWMISHSPPAHEISACVCFGEDQSTQEHGHEAMHVSAMQRSEPKYPCL